MKIKISFTDEYGIELYSENLTLFDCVYKKAQLISTYYPVYWDGFTYCPGFCIWYLPNEYKN